MSLSKSQESEWVVRLTFGRNGNRLCVVASGNVDFAYDGSNVVRALTEGDTADMMTGIAATYLLGPSGPMYRRPANAADVRWYVYDGLGSVVGEVDVNGILCCQKTTDVYGISRGVVGTALSRHGFVGGLGHYSDSETGLVYMRARYYDPAVGRFISQDKHRSGANWFVYCSSDPVNRSDPSGQEDLAEVMIATSESMGIDGLDGMGLKELEGTLSVSGDTMNVMVDWIESTGPGQFQRETFVDVLEEVAEGRGCNAIRWVGQSEEGSAGYNMKLKIATELMEPDCFSHESGVTMLYWVLDAE